MCCIATGFNVQLAEPGISRAPKIALVNHIKGNDCDVQVENKSGGDGSWYHINSKKNS